MIIILLGVIAIAACGADGAGNTSGTSGNPGATQVIASVYPLEFAAVRVGGADVEVRNLTPPGAEPHDFELAPRDFELLRSADLLLYVGHGFQPAIEDAAGSADGSVVDVLKTPGLNLRHLEAGGNAHAGEAEVDPHIWLDPIAFSKIAGEIRQRLDSDADATGFEDDLAELDAEFRDGLAKCRHDVVVTSHAAFGYLTDRYGLRQVSIAGLSPDDDSTPRELEDVIDTVRDTGAAVVYSETLASPRLAETVARETGARTAVLNPIESLTENEREAGEDYFSLMRKNLRALQEGLECS